MHEIMQSFLRFLVLVSVLRTSQELKNNRKEVELYGGGRVSEGNADVMELGHSNQRSREVPVTNTSTDAPAGNTVPQVEPRGEWLKKEAGQRLSSGSGESTESFKFGDEDNVPTKPVIVLTDQTFTEPQ